MKRIASKIVLAVFIMSPMTADASLGQYAKNSIGTVLQSVGSNARSNAAVVSAFTAILILRRAYNIWKHSNTIIADIKNKKKQEEFDTKNISWHE